MMKRGCGTDREEVRCSLDRQKSSRGTYGVQTETLSAAWLLTSGGVNWWVSHADVWDGLEFIQFVKVKLTPCFCWIHASQTRQRHFLTANISSIPSPTTHTTDHSDAWIYNLTVTVHTTVVTYSSLVLASIPSSTFHGCRLEPVVDDCNDWQLWLMVSSPAALPGFCLEPLELLWKEKNWLPPLDAHTHTTLCLWLRSYINKSLTGCCHCKFTIVNLIYLPF